MLTCLECGSTKAKLVPGSRVYPHRADLHRKYFWLCPCGAYCGTHPGGTAPLGSPAGRETRAARMRAHSAFDPLWADGEMTRRDAYAWLSEALQIDPKDCHIGMMDKATAERVPVLVAEIAGPPKWVRDLMEDQ